MPKRGRKRERETATKIKPGKMCPQSHRAWALSQLHFTWPYFTALGNFQASKKVGGRGQGAGLDCCTLACQEAQSLTVAQSLAWAVH